MEFVLFDGDELEYDDKFEDAVVELPKRALLKGSGKLTCNRRRACVQGDEDDVSVIANCSYTTRRLMEPGTGTVKLLPLNGESLARVTDGGKRLLKTGVKLVAFFEVDKPAKEKVRGKEPAEEDKEKKYQGTARFVAKQKLLEAY